MALTLQTLTEQLIHAKLAKHDGAEVLLRGMHLLIDHANSPWNTLMLSLCPPRPVMSDLLQKISESVGPPGDEACLAIALQYAYLQAFRSTLDQSSGMLEARYNLDDVPCEENWIERLTVYCEQITTFPIDIGQFDFRDFSNAAFIQEYIERFTQIWLKMRLFRYKHAAFDHAAFDAQNLARRISYVIYPFLLRHVADNHAFYVPLIQHLYRGGHWDSAELAKYKGHLLALPAESVFQENCAIQDIYVELQATHVVQPSPPLRYGTPEAWDEASFEEGPQGLLMQMVLDQLDDREHVIFIQAKPGQGKSVFCAMLAAKVALRYPEWIPVLIRLRDENFHADLPLEEALRQYIEHFLPFTDDLLQSHRFLLIFDGFDELPLSPESGQALRRFFFALSEFQQQCARDNYSRHKVVITGRPISIQDLESNLPDNFWQLTIKPLENPQLFTWLGNWEKLVDPRIATAFRMFLEDGNVFHESDATTAFPLKRITRNPLLLFLLGELYKCQIVTSIDLSKTVNPVDIYNQMISWICGDVVEASFTSREQERLMQKGISPKTLRKILQEIATCIWHEQRTLVPLTHIQNYLSSAAPRSAKKLTHSGLRRIHNIVISLSFQPVSTTQTVGFSHKSFGEYLAAEKMSLSLRKISEPFADAADLKSPSLQEAAHRFYSVFGITLLTDEIWEFMMDILSSHYTPDEQTLMTERLYRLYITYSNGRWMNEDIARTQWGVLKRYDMPLDLLQFEAQAGINLFVLLCLLYWKTQETFDISGRPDEGTFDANRFRKLLAFGELVGTFGLFRRVSHLLSGVNLQRANLLCANLRRVNLQNANVRAAILRDANLRGANLQGTCLDDADLRVASLQNANLSGATVRGANMEDVVLRDANLVGVDLKKANLLCADLRDADLSDADLQESVLYGTLLQGANFEGVNFTGAIMSKQQLARDIHLFSEKQVAQFHVVHD